MDPKLSTDVDGDVTNQTLGYVATPVSPLRPNARRINPDVFNDEVEPMNTSKNGSEAKGPDVQDLALSDNLNQSDLSERGNNQRPY